MYINRSLRYPMQNFLINLINCLLAVESVLKVVNMQCGCSSTEYFRITICTAICLQRGFKKRKKLCLLLVMVLVLVSLKKYL